ncbi:ras association domain-containing protein 7-like [Labrus mixtus]|uniref:ras association domain-containing protein 7-like n=1 Tax=Labrus mixtus TaxID=508554 RepID=UPI0029C0170A|nr:ras association domain-containing protein 7-like [Labrus mixtus]
MELKVWVEGVARVVCGLSLNTSCQDVVIALAQSIGQTGRYVLILKLRGTERQMVADDCPLQLLAQLGQQAAEVRFVLRRTGPSLSDGRDTPTRQGGLPLPGSAEPDPVRSREPHKAFTFNLGPSTSPRRTKSNRAWSPSPRASPEPRASPVSFLDPINPVQALHPSSKDDVFRQILQQQRRLQDLEIELQALERETDMWEQESSSAGLNLVSDGELEELEQRLSLNQEELMHREHWERQLQKEIDRERDMHGRLNQMQLSMEDHSFQIRELYGRSAYLEQDPTLRAHRQSAQTGPRQPDEALRPLKQQLHQRLQQGDEMDITLSETQKKLRAAEDQLQDKWEMIEELNKELRQCNLQQFIQQTGGPHTDQTNSLQVTEVYLRNAGIME